MARTHDREDLPISEGTTVKRLFSIALLLAAAASLGVGVGTANAAAYNGNGCEMDVTDFIPSGAGKPSIRFQTYCTTQQKAWAVTVWCSHSVDSQIYPWSQCANTHKVTKYGNGDATWTIPVGDGWAPNCGQDYRGKAEFGNGSTTAGGFTTFICG